MYRESIPCEENPGASLLGQTIDPAYRLTSLLDSSGTCDVYRAWDHSDDRYVVVKLLRLRCEPPVLERITKHIRSLCYEAFPHVVPVLAHGIHQGYPYVILPYLAGGTLRQRRPTENHRALHAHPALRFTWLPR
ncbi:MAG: hypothetical protein ACKOTB_06280, partial [Planctomycetia bacterium]